MWFKPFKRKKWQKNGWIHIMERELCFCFSVYFCSLSVWSSKGNQRKTLSKAFKNIFIFLNRLFALCHLDIQVHYLCHVFAFILDLFLKDSVLLSACCAWILYHNIFIVTLSYVWFLRFIYFWSENILKMGHCQTCLQSFAFFYSTCFILHDRCHKK